MDIIGPKSLHAGQLIENYFRNATQLYTLGESIDGLSTYIALAGLQHAGVNLKCNLNNLNFYIFWVFIIFSP